VAIAFSKVGLERTSGGMAIVIIGVIAAGASIAVLIFGGLIDT
jgi:hypothetical protein